MRAVVLFACLLAPAPAFAAFGVTDLGTTFSVESGAGLVFTVNKANGDITSIVFNGVEYKSTTGRFSHIASGLGSTGTTVTADGDGATYVKITIQTGPTNGVSPNLTHYLIVRNGENTIYMATFPTVEPGVGELRWITRLNSALIPDGPEPSNLRDNTGAIESSDVFGRADGTTRSKYYGDNVTRGKDRAMDLTYSGATGPGIGCWMVFGSRESSSGGPFFRDIQNQGGTDQEIYNYMNSGHNQTEANRLNVLHGPYALVFTTGEPPSLPLDFSWLGDLGLVGWVPPSQRGSVSGAASGIPAGFQGVVGFKNSTAQYWAIVAPDGTYSANLMKPGTYTATLFKGELEVATASVTVAAGATTTLDLASTEVNPSVIFRIGEWDGTPAGLLNGHRIVEMHPSDVRMSAWDATTFVAGTDAADTFPAIQFRGKNSPTTIRFTLAPNQIVDLTLKIGITAAYNGGRPQITVNSFTSGQPAASSQPNSRSFTIGTYRGNNALFTYTIPASALVAGINTLTINPISGSTDLGTWLSAGWVYDAVELVGPIATPVITYAGSSPLVIGGTSEPGRTVSVTLDGVTAIGSGVAAADGTWSVTYAGPLSAGTHSVTATASDAFGHSSPASAAFVFNTALTMPTILSATGDTGTYASGATTSDRVFVFRGAAGAGDTVQLTRSGTGTIGAAVADASGEWTFDYTSVSLPDGVNSFFATTVSGGSNSASSPIFSLNLQGQPRIAIVRYDPAAATIPSGLSSVVFRVVFNHAVSGVTTDAFALVTTGSVTATIASVSAPAGTTFDVTVTDPTGVGTMRLILKPASGVVDANGNPEAGYTAGEAYTVVLPTTGNGTWTRTTTGGRWGDPANWLDAVIADGSSSAANFSTIDLTADQIVRLDGARTLNSASFADADTATPASWTIDGSADPNNALTLAGTAPAITVAALGTGATATLRAPLLGSAGLTKSGAGILVLEAPSGIAGPLNVSAGRLRLAPGGSLSLGNNPVNLSLNSQINVAGGSFATDGLVSAATAQVVIDGGSASLGSFRTNSDFGAALRVTGGALTAGDVNIRRNSAANPDFNSGFIVAGTGVANVGTIGLGTANSTGAMSIEGSGALTATGTITIGNQTSGSRGGAMRVLGGTFTSTDAVNGIVLSRRNGTNANNIATATFTGGISTVEKITLGFDSTVTAGSATVTLNGGTLYLGSGGIVKNGTGAFVTNLNFSAGTLGAKADWATAVPVNLPTAGNVSIKAADASNAPFTIAFGGPLTGAGGFTKTGIGTLLLTATNTFSGAAVVAAGVLRVDGAVGAGAAMTVGGGALSGAGSVNRAVVLESAGTIQPGGSAPGTALTVGSLTWHGGGTLAIDLASGRRLAVSGALTRGAGGPLNVSLVTSAPLTRGSIFTLATFASTNTVPPDYVVTGPAGHRGVILLDGTSLRFLVTGVGTTAAYTDWAYHKGLPPDAEGPADDPDNDALSNLVEFLLETDPMRANPQPVRATTVAVDGRTYPAVAFTRRQDLGGVTANVVASPDARFTSLAETTEVSVSPRGDGTDDVVVRSTTPLANAARQFFRVTATYPDPELTLRSLPVGVVTTPLGGESTGVAVPLIASDLFVGTVTSSGGNVLSFGTASANVGALLAEGGRYYVEIVTGTFEGERFDVDAAATIAAATSDVVLSFGPGSVSTPAQLPAAGLEGARAVLRPHLTLAALQALLSPGLAGSDDPDAADTVSVLENGQWQRFYLRADGVTWSWKDSVEDFRHKVLAPGTSVLLDLRSGEQVLLQAGNVRVNAFRKNLVEGYQSFASGFPVDLSPREIGAIADDSATGWTGSNAPGRADEITVRRVAPHADDAYYLRGDGSTWRSLTHPASVTDDPILGALNAIVVKRNRPNDGFRIPPPFDR